MERKIFSAVGVVMVMILVLVAWAPAPTMETVVAKESVVVDSSPEAIEENATAAPAPKPGNILTRPWVYAVGTETSSMDPDACEVGWCRYPQLGPYETLLRWEKQSDGTWGPAPWLAKSWDISDDGLKYTFHLQEGVKFSDGTPFKAEAVKWNFERLAALGLQPSTKLDYSQDLKVEAVDEYTVKLTLPVPHAPFIRQIIQNPAFVSPSAAKAHQKEGKYGANGDYAQGWLFENAVGTGPYLLKEWKKGETVTLVKNPDYWRGWKGNHLESIIVRTVPESTTRKLLTQRGESDMMEEPDFSDIPLFGKSPKLTVYEQIPGSYIITIQIRKKGPFLDQRVRKAAALAFDYGAFVNDVLSGRADVAHSPLVRDVEFGYDKSLPAFERDVKKAKQLMTEAGYPNGLPGEWELWIIPGFQWFQRTEAQLFQSNMKDIGINIKIQEWADLAGWQAGVLDPNIEKQPTFYSWNWAGLTGDADTNLRQMYYGKKIPPNGMNGMQYNDPEFDRLLDEAVISTNPAKRLEIYAKLQRMLIEAQPSIWIANQNNYIIFSKETKGFVRSPTTEGNIQPGTYWDMWLEGE